MTSRPGRTVHRLLRAGGTWLPHLIAIAGGVSPSSVPAQAALVHDSGTVRVVVVPARKTLRDNRFLAATGIPRGGGISERPEDELSQRNGYLRGFAISGDGMAALDGARVRVYSPDGTLTSSFGRFGAGPGEARLYTSGCVTRGDTLVAFDNGTRRLTVATRSGGIVRQLNVSRLGYLIRYGCFDDGTLLFERLSVTSAARYELVRADLHGHERGVLVSYPARHTVWRVKVAAKGDVVAIADPLAQHVAVLDTLGRLRVSVRLRESIETLSAAELRSLDQPLGTDAVRGSQGERRRPLFGDVILDRDGVIWLADFTVTPVEAASWTGVSTASGDLYRFSLERHPLRESWPPAQVLEIDARGALVLFTEPELGSKVFSRFALRGAP